MSSRKVLASTKDVKSGMILAQDVYNTSDVLLIPKDLKLNQSCLDKIDELGITSIWVLDDYVDGITQQEFDRMQQETNKGNSLKKELSETCKQAYSHSKESVQDVLSDLSKGKSVDMKKVAGTSENLLKEFSYNLDIVRALNSFRGSDDYTYTHSINVALLCSMMGKWLNMNEQEIKDLTMAGLLHDLGKAKIPLEILNKPAGLTDEEYETVKDHSVMGYRAVEALNNVNNNIKMGVLMHHERLDGSGYPLRAKGPQIHQYAKIVGIADVFDAMTSDKVYKKKRFPFEVFEELERMAFNKLEPELLFLFLKNMAKYYVGEIVQLNTGEYGEIVFINPTCVYKPIIKVDNAFVDLLYESNVRIESFAV
ncbi:MAG: HD-GYP domain-containing protein [Clostridia bacterium]